MTLRENAQFIDELRQHYRRLDGLLVKHKDRLGPIDVWEFNHPVIALRKLLFGGVGDPNLQAADAASATQPQGATNAGVVERAVGAHDRRPRGSSQNGATRDQAGGHYDMPGVPRSAVGDPRGEGAETARTRDGFRRLSPIEDASKTPSDPPSPEEIEDRKLGAPTGASPVKLEVVR